MAKRNIFRGLAAVLALGMCMTGLAGCGSEKRADGKTEIEVVSYKPEAVKAFEKIEKRFNETHDDIHLTISSPNEAISSAVNLSAFAWQFSLLFIQFPSEIFFSCSEEENELSCA